MQALAGFCLLLFVATVSVVGIRMLLLARRTRGRHELLIGAGMVLIGTIGFPGGIVSGFGGPVRDLNLPVWLVSLFITQIGITLVYVFTWQVFRPHARWGKGIVAGGASLMLVSLVGSALAVAAAAPEESSQAVSRNAVFLGMIGYCGCFLWSAIEGFIHHRNARRRMALGLADATVVNRFLLWGVFGLCATGINATSFIGNAIGADPAHSPLVLVPMGVLGAIASVAMYLAFLPPASYLKRLRARGLAA